MIKEGATPRGFAIVEFSDRNGRKCSLQKSSLAFEDCVWFGANEIGLERFTPGSGWKSVPLEQSKDGVTHVANNRMHLSRDTVAELLPYLERFVQTGELTRAEDDVRWVLGDVSKDDLETLADQFGGDEAAPGPDQRLVELARRLMEHAR